MMTKRHGVAWFAVAGLLTLAPTAGAGERLSVSGPIYFVADPAGVVEMEKGHSIIFARWNGTAVHEDTSAPWHNTRVDCVGMVDSRPDGSWDASGYCMHTDRDGDQWVGKWRNGSAMKEYVFEAYRGVNGKYVGATGGGTGTCTELRSGPKATSVCVNKGDLVLK